jgi:hypothetical protein
LAETPVRPIRDLRGAWESACIAAGFFRVLPLLDAAGEPRVAKDGTPMVRKKATKLVHDFRRAAVRNLERAGVARSVAMRLTGHKTESVYRRYAIVSESDLTEGVKKLARLRAHATKHAKTSGTMRVLPFAATGKDRAKSAAVGG